VILILIGVNITSSYVNYKVGNNKTSLANLIVSIILCYMYFTGLRF